MSFKLFCTIIFQFILCFDLNCCDDIFGCGGFVKSDYEINYSRVEVKLYTKHGSLKYHTDCAPHNGYYLIPVYDKGDYILKIEPPQGWNFEPSSVDLHIDGISDQCSLNQDINFVFKGFTLTGQILSRYGKPGPADIKLLLKDSSSKVRGETKSSDGGHYSFQQLFPGKYSIEASHDKFLFDQSKEFVSVADNLKTTNNIIVAGYDVSGLVYSDGQPIQGVYFLLFSESSASIPKACKTETVKGFSSKVKQPYLCHVTSTNDGKFVFPSVPPGKYKLVPFYKGEHIEFDVSPSEMDFTVEGDSVTIEKSFQIQGFSVSGWIGTGPKGKSIAGVDVFIDGSIHGTSDENGLYHLENMRAGTYQLILKKELYVFDPIEMKINPNTPRLPDIYVSKLSVCGHVQLDDYPPGINKGQQRNVAILSATGNEKYVIPINSDGHYCYSLVKGKYFVQAIVSETESSFGLKFIPDKHTIEVLDDSIMNINFRQFRADVRGKVKCISKCEGVTLDLEPLLGDMPNMKTEVGEEGSFKFDKCLPGNYVLNVQKEDWCFQSKMIKFAITDKDVVNLEFNQIGFQVTITLTHASSFKVKYPSSETHSVELQKSKNLLCLPEKGVYEFIPVGCHLYKKDVFKFDSNNPSEIDLSPTKHLVTGSILTEINVTDIKVHLKKQANENEEIISLQEPLDKKGNYFRYTFSLFTQPYSEVELRVLSKQLIFRPVKPIQVLDECLENAVEIIGKLGRFMNGSVTPPMEGVDITVFMKETNLLFAKTVTDKEGKFLIGPLEEDSDYTVNAKKDGFIFTEQDKKGEFLAFKLAEIVVEVKDEDGALLSGALLSLSGGTNYRKNSITQSDGKLSFTDLGPGQYFLRPMLKEYSFEPSSKMIDIKEGTQELLKIKGKRVAYSLYGTVTSLTGEAEVGIAVEALGIPSSSCVQYQEEALSEQGGAFRIRGLQPNCDYTLHLKPGADVNQHIERAAPKEIPIKVTNGDITGVRLIVFRYYGQMDVSGNVITNQEYLQTLKVRLFREDAPDQIVHSLVLGQSSFFYLPSMPIDNKNYILKLESTLSTSSYSFNQPSMTFCANTSFYHFTFSFEPQVKSVEQEVTQGSVLALPLTIIILLLVYNYSKLLPLASHVFTLLSSAVNPNRTFTSTESSLPESTIVRRKARPKRIQ